MRDVWRRALETEHLLTTEALRGEPRGLLYWGPWRIRKGRLLKWAFLSTGAPLGEHGGDAAWLVSLRERWDFVLSGDLVDWGIWKRCKTRLWKRSSLHTGATMGNLQGGSFYQEHSETEEQLWKWSISIYDSSVRDTWREGSFTGDPEGLVKRKALDTYLSP